MVSSGDLSVLTTVVAQKDNDPLKIFSSCSFLSGKVLRSWQNPGGFLERGRPTENETLVSRLIDRPLDLFSHLHLPMKFR